MKYTRTILKNGIRLITIPMENNPTVTVLVGVGTGAFYETAQQAGISHFLEHMCFKGTTKRPSPTAISIELDSMGAGYNASTSREITNFYVKADAKHFEKVGDVVADIYLNSIFPESEIEKEKGVVCGEIDMYADEPQEKIADALRIHMYKGEQAERDVLGAKETVKAIKRDDLITYRNSQYKASNTVIAIAGGVSESAMVVWAEKTFGALADGAVQKENPTADRAQTEPETVFVDKDTDQAHIIMAWRAFSRNHPDRFIVSLLTTILRGGMSSRLFVTLRENLGSGYYIGAGPNFYKSFGLYAISTGTTADRVPEIVAAIRTEIQKLRTTLVTNAEIDKAKEIKRARRLMALETSDDIADFFADQELLEDKIRTPEEFDSIYSKITADDILRVAKSLFNDNKMTVAVIGNKLDKDAITKVSKAGAS